MGGTNATTQFQIESFLYWSIVPEVQKPYPDKTAGGRFVIWLWLVENVPVLAALQDDVVQFFKLGHERWIAKATVSISLTLVTLILQQLTERFQLSRLGSAHLPMSHYYPGIEYQLVTIGVVISAFGQYIVPEMCNCGESPSRGTHIGVAWILTLLIFSAFVALEKPAEPVAKHPSSGRNDESMTQIISTPSRSRSNSPGSFLRGPFVISVLTLLIVSAFLA